MASESLTPARPPANGAIVVESAQSAERHAGAGTLVERASPSRILLRIAAALLGGYAFTWGFTAFGMVGLVALGVDFGEAETGILLLSFLVFLTLFLWAFAAASLTRVWVVLSSGAVLMTIASLALQRLILP